MKKTLFQKKRNHLNRSISLLVITIIFFIQTPLAFAENVNFFAAAHQDDWQLFMGSNAYKSAKNSGTKTVIIHTTAGDAGAGTGSIGRPFPYYIARNEGSLRAIRFIANTFNGNQGEEMPVTQQTFNGHNISRYTYGSTVMYFLSLPDGNIHGRGYASTGGESLQKLFNGGINKISAIDNSSTYNSWADLVLTLQKIVQFESVNAQSIAFHIADTDSNFNPEDHPDHIHTSKLMQDAAQINTCINLSLYQDYVTKNKAVNLSHSEVLIEAGIWGATTSGLSDFYHKNTWDSTHTPFLGKQYFRTLSGSGSCFEPSIEINIASSALITASSGNSRTSQTPDKAIDGVIDGWPRDYRKEWATVGEKQGAWLKLQWSSAVSIRKINLFDRPNEDDHITSAALIFSDGSQTNVSALNNNGSKTEILLPSPKTTTSIELKILGTSSRTRNVGLAEIEVIQVAQ